MEICLLELEFLQTICVYLHGDECINLSSVIAAIYMKLRPKGTLWLQACVVCMGRTDNT